jgi:predicted MFS family arabinose efflux permease
VFWVYLTDAALAAAGLVDFPLIAFHLSGARIVSEPVVAVCYAVAMAISGTGSLIFGRQFDWSGIGMLIPLTIAGAAYAPLVFLGGTWAALVGVALWGLAMGVQESIIPAAVAPMVSPDRRASAYGLFTGGYGTAWVLGSVVIGLLFGVSLGAVTTFAVVAQLAAIPLLVVVGRRTRSGGGPGWHPAGQAPSSSRAVRSMSLSRTSTSSAASPSGMKLSWPVTRATWPR